MTDCRPTTRRNHGSAYARLCAAVGALPALVASLFVQAAVVATAGAAEPAPADREFVRAIADAVRHQPDFGSQQASVGESRSALTTARADFLPRVQMLVDSGEDRTVRDGQAEDIPGSRRSGEINPQLALSQLVYDGGAAWGRYRAAKERVGSATLGVDAVANNLALKGVQLHFTVLRQREAVRIAIENRDKVASVRDKVAGRATAGRDPRSEQSRLDSRVLEAESELEDARRNLDDADAAYEEFFGAAPTELVVPQSWPLRRERVADALRQARDYNPELLSLRDELDASDAELRAERATLFWPRLSLEVTGTAYDAFGGEGMKNRDTYVGLRVSYDLFSGGASQARADQAGSRRRIAALSVERAELALDRNLRQAYAAVAAREIQIASMTERVQRDRQAIDDYEELFLAGRRTLNDLIVAQRDYFTSAMQFLDVELDLRVQRFSVAALTGELASYFGLDARTDDSGGDAQ